MALRIGIAGYQNSGKSYSRKFIDKGENCFIIAPSHKMTHLTNSKNEPLKRLDFKTEKVASIKEAVIKTGMNRNAIVKASIAKDDIENIIGNWDVVDNLQYLTSYLDFVVQKMPHIDVIILPDFTHYISKILATKSFIDQKSGGGAFQRFWELAANALNSFFLYIDKLPEDLIVVTEFHIEFDESAEMYRIFVPGGKMLNDKFLADSYYDILLYTHVESEDDFPEDADRYKFVTKRIGKYNARCAGIFKDAYIENNLQEVINRVKAYNGLIE